MRKRKIVESFFGFCVSSRSLHFQMKKVNSGFIDICSVTFNFTMLKGQQTVSSFMVGDTFHK